METSLPEYQYSIADIQEVYFKNLLSDNSISSDKQIQYSYLIQTIVNEKAKIVRNRVGVIYYIDNQISLQMEIDISYNLPSFEGLLSINQKIVNYNKDFIFHLLTLSFATLRGMLFERARNTPFQNYHLPLISIKQLTQFNSFIIET